MGEKEKFSFRFDVDVKKKLEHLINGKEYTTVTSKIEDSIKLLDNLYACAEMEVKHYFNINEGKFIINMFKGTKVKYSDNASIKHFLLDIYRRGRLSINSEENIDFDRLSEKMNKLNDLQAYVIINKLVEYWSLKETEENLSIYDLSIIESNNIYSVDVIYRDNMDYDIEEIRGVITDNLNKNYFVDKKIKLKEIEIPFISSISIAFRSNKKIDAFDRMVLKESIRDNIGSKCNIVDININNVNTVGLE